MPNIKLFVNADKYCKIDVWPNLKFKFETPNIIFSSLSRFIYGKWYKPASGLYILLFVISKKIIKAEEEQNKIKFLIKKIFLYLKIITKLNINNIEFIKGFNGKKKFKNNAIKEIVINPKISCKEKDDKLLPLWK